MENSSNSAEAASKILPYDALTRLGSGQLDLTALQDFPFYHQLCRMWKPGTPEGEENLRHSQAVLSKMNVLLSPEPWRILNRPDPRLRNRLTEVKVAVMNQLYGEQGAVDPALLFRLAALYHDIGKYIIRERHPTIGWYTMQYLSPADRARLLDLLDQREDMLQLLILLVRDHDLFGTLCTGEASYPILLNPISSMGGSPEEQKRIVSVIMWLNLADMAATLDEWLTPYDIEKVLADWKWVCDAIDDCAEKKQRLDEYIIREASREEIVIQRLCRLVMESSRRFPNRLKEYTREYSGMSGSEPQIYRMVRAQLSTVYGTQTPRREFASQFTHIVKLDYGLRFFTRLVEYCEGPGIATGALPFHAEKRVDGERLIYAILAILRRITSTYLAMSRGEDDSGNLVGVEMKDLTPGNAPEKTAQMCRLLIESQYSGLSWMMSDCPAWYF